MAYGTRYLSLKQFITYCKNLKVNTDEKELEYYENQGLMLPAARVIKPREYVQEEYDWFSYDKGELDKSKWPELFQLNDVPFRGVFSDDELIDSFDRCLESQNPYITIPTKDNYRSWDSYNIVVKDNGETRTNRSIAEHLYSYWQVHQLYKIQSYPDLYKNKYLISFLPNDVKEHFFLSRALNTNIYREFENHSHLFDALSFFIVMYNREKKRTFATTPIEDGIKTLNDFEYKRWSENISKHSQFVATRYKLTDNHLLNFLIFLLDKKRDYEDKEKIKLSKEIEQDIHYCIMFIRGLTNKDITEIGEEIGKISQFWIKDSLLNVNLHLKYAGRAKTALEACFKQFEKEFSIKGFAIEQIEEIIKYCLDKELIILLYSLDQSVFIGEEIYNEDTSIRRHVAIMNLATSFEYMLGTFNKSSNLTTLNELIKKVFKNEYWKQDFDLITDRKRGGWKRDSDFNSYDENINKARAQPDLDLRNILLTYIARNLFVHNIPPSMWVFRDIYGELFSAIKYSIINSWLVAKKDGLI